MGQIQQIHISVDLETYSSVDLKKSGLYKYAQSPDFDILERRHIP